MPGAGHRMDAGRIPGEEIARTTTSADSATFTTTEVQVMSVVAPLVNGRVYKIVFDGAFEITVDGVLRSVIREDSSAGTIIQIRDIVIDNSGTAAAVHAEVFFTAIATANKTFVVMGDVLAGAGTANLSASGTFPSYLYVEYVSG